MIQGLQVKGLTKSIEGNPIFRDISFNVIPGQVLALVGDSGSGKTTLLKTLNRLIDFDSGEILLNGKSITDLEPIELRRRAGMLLQTATMFNGTVYENINYGLKIRGGVNNGNDRLFRALSDAGLIKSFLKKDAQKLSGGEQQRVALARVLVLEPEILLLDEPTAALDPKLTRRIEKTILRLCKSRNLIIIWVTHNHAQARRVGDLIGILKNGGLKIIQNSKSNTSKMEHKKKKHKGGL